jgi:hypothetical protein
LWYYKKKNTIKKKSEALHEFYLYNIGMHYTFEQLIFIDKTAKDKRTFTRLHSYFSINTRVKKNVIFIRGKCYTILSALSLESFITVNIIERSCNKKKFQIFILTQLVI